MNHQFERAAVAEANGCKVTHVAGRQSADAERLGERHDRTIDQAQPTLGHIQAVVLEQQIVKRPQTPADVAAAVVFLASPDGEFVTGQALNVNGGAAHH